MSDVLDFFISKFRSHLDLDNVPSQYHRPRPYRNAAVRFRECSLGDFEERRRILEQEAGLNVFLFRADKIPGCDLLSDSGTTTMTMEQWAAMLLGDEAYGSNEGYFALKEQVGRTFGEAWRQEPGLLTGEREPLFIFHQGRAAENALFTVLSRELKEKGFPRPKAFSSSLLPELRARIAHRMVSVKGQTPGPYEPFFVIPSNSHFDTTEGNIADKFMVPLNLPCREHLANDSRFPFRGNMDLDELENLLSSEPERVPLVYLTVTNNTGGGQPVSMENIRRVGEIARAHNVPFFLDACRFAENAWFIQQKEGGFRERSIETIVREMFEHTDGFHISFKKDGLGNIGGAVCIRQGSLFTKKYPRFMEDLTDFQIMTEGHPTYGGLAGRDLEAIAQGLKEVVEQDYQEYRHASIRYVVERLAARGVPVLQPAGGHAIFLDAARFLPHLDWQDYPGQALAIELYLAGGIRACEIGSVMLGRVDAKGLETPAPHELVRLAIPRRTYTQSHMDYVIEVLDEVWHERESIGGVRIERAPRVLRHFRARFARLPARANVQERLAMPAAKPHGTGAHGGRP